LFERHPKAFFGRDSQRWELILNMLGIFKGGQTQLGRILINRIEREMQILGMTD